MKNKKHKDGYWIGRSVGWRVAVGVGGQEKELQPAIKMCYSY